MIPLGVYVDHQDLGISRVRLITIDQNSSVLEHLLGAGMLTRPQPHEAEATTHEAEATTHEAEATTYEAEAKTHLEILIIII